MYETDIENCIAVLQNGGTILYPTDTIWGIGCDATNEEAVEKVFNIKRRPQQKSFVVLVAEERDVLKYTASPDLSVFDYLQRAERPTTVIYPHAVGLASNALGADGSVAIRISKDEFCRHLIKRFRRPIISTSANISGRGAPSCFSEIEEEVKNKVDYVVTFRQDDFSHSPPSSIIRWENGHITVIR